MIELLFGMIASGKSTYALKRAREGALIISHDALVSSLHIDYKYDKDLHDLYHTIEDVMLRSIIAHSNRDIIIDRTHLTKRSRARWVKLAKELNVPIEIITFKTYTPEIHARRRANSESRGLSYDIWLKITTHHYNTIEPINCAEEGFSACRPNPYYFRSS